MKVKISKKPKRGKVKNLKLLKKNSSQKQTQPVDNKFKESTCNFTTTLKLAPNVTIGNKKRAEALFLLG